LKSQVKSLKEKINCLKQ